LDATALYTQCVLDHQRAPRNFGRLEGHTHAADGANPLCGDSMHVELRCADGRIAAMRFDGAACAVATATASMLSEIAPGRSAGQIDELEARFRRLIDGTSAHDDLLADLNALSALARHPARRKCALLAFATLRAALAGTASATTEGNP
jgi:nitrogen fixation NifU-like protein